MLNRRLSIGLLALAMIAALFTITVPGNAAPTPTSTHTHTISYDKYSLLIDGKRQLVYAGEVHPFRLPSPDEWFDVLQKMKAAGFNTVTAYFDWDYHSPAPGVYDFTGVRNMDEFLDMAAAAGLYVIARPGPYINAETDGGGMPGWWNGQPGNARSNDPRYEQYAMQWMHQIDTILARHQLTTGTGTVILEQVENEFTDTSSSATAYMADLEKQIRADGITVPLSGNHWGDYITGQGATQLPGYDQYPDGFNCANQTIFNPAGDQWSLHDTLAGSPLYIPEYQGGSFDPWGGAGFAACASMVSGAFEATSARDLLASGAGLISYYMTYGGTSWGYEPYPGGYTSYDYGAAINEARQLTPKYYDQKRIAAEVNTVPALAQLDRVSAGNAANAALHEIVDQNTSTGTHLYLLQHNDNGAKTDDATTISVQTADGSYSVPQQPNTAIHVNGQTAKMLLADYDIPGAHVVYSTSEFMTDANQGNANTAVFYGPKGEPGETVLRYAAQPTVQVLSGTVSTSWDASKGDLRLDYTHNGIAQVRITSGGRTFDLLLADTASTDRLWLDGTGSGQLISTGPYLVRTGTVHGSTAVLTGDTDGATTLTVHAPAGVTQVSWNGALLATHRDADGSLTGGLGGAPGYQLPTLDSWKFQYGTAESDPSFNDSSWAVANNSQLGADYYGFHHGFVWYRGHFTATGGETGITLNGQGGSPAGEYEVWLNGAELGTSPSGSTTFTFPPGLLQTGKDNVISVLNFNSGHEEGGGQTVRGLTSAALNGSTAAMTWRIQGAQGGEQLLDPTRGPLNVGGLDGERAGWYLPGYPDQNWRNVSLPDSWAQRGLPSGDGWYRDTFNLNLPVGTDIPLGLKINDNSGAAYRALIFVNGWQLGEYANDLGPQHVFSLPPGILHTNGQNTVAIAVWGLNGSSGGLGAVSLVPYGTYAGGVSVHNVAAPNWNAKTWGQPTSPSRVTIALTNTTIVSGGAQVTVTGAVDNVAKQPATVGTLNLTTPTGWQATANGSTNIGTLAPGQVKKVSWTVSVPAGAKPGQFEATATTGYQLAGSARTAAGTAQFTVPYANLSDTFDNIGISDDTNPSAGDFDGAGYSFSAQALAAAGLTPGNTAQHDGIGFTWPSAAAGTADNVAADGQAIAVSGSGNTLAFIGASNSGSPGGPGTVVYTDGSTATFSLTLDDFWFAPGGNETVATMPYLNSPTGKYQQTVYIDYQSVPIDPTKKVAAVVLPAISTGSAGHNTAMHIFAIGVGTH
ncbi:MAG TPA: beta-galactosidase [Pseudonocardiaceae bacterium]|jgi:beta-galactosidase|nr:beta-galactosidase [Pseudonocardiaceae bacterium]